jgi:anti-sigma regulatory factor (Ser/Thr protein kinase)
MNVRNAPLHLASEPGEPSDLMARLGVALMGAPDIDEVARRLLDGLMELKGIHRVGLALSEVGGRRLRFTSSTAITEESVTWCHIDAYEDVPLTAVVRNGEAIISGRNRMHRRYDTFVSHQPDEVQGFAVVPLAGTGSPVGGLILYLRQVWEPTGSERRLIDSVAQHAADAVRRVRALGSRDAAETSAGEELVGHLVLHDDPRSVGRARRFLRGFVADENFSADVVDTAELCLSELATNALMHSDGTYELRVTLDGRMLTVAVRDRGSYDREAVAEPSIDDDPLVISGRGLQLVEVLADRWGSERDALGTIVWFALDVESASSQATG